MNKLCSYLHHHLDGLVNNPAYNTRNLKLSETRVRDDRLIVEVYEIFIKTDEYYIACREDLINGTGLRRRLKAYLEWAETLEPCQLESRFNSHEIMELFSNE